MYVLKIGALYFVGTRGDMAGCADSDTGIALSYHQRDARRFPVMSWAHSAPLTIKDLFGADARFVKLTQRQPSILDNDDYLDDGAF